MLGTIHKAIKYADKLPSESPKAKGFPTKKFRLDVKLFLRDFSSDIGYWALQCVHDDAHQEAYDGSSNPRKRELALQVLQRAQSLIMDADCLTDDEIMDRLEGDDRHKHEFEELHV